MSLEKNITHAVQLFDEYSAATPYMLLPQRLKPSLPGNSEKRPCVVTDFSTNALLTYYVFSNVLYFNEYKIQKSIGLPVVDHILLFPSNECVLTPDISRGGRIYGKLDVYSESAPVEPDENRLVDTKFVALMGNPETATAILHCLLSYADLATKANYFLPYDDAFQLHVMPDSSWEVVALDVDYGISAERATVLWRGFSPTRRKIYKSGVKAANTYFAEFSWRCLQNTADVIRARI